MTQTKITKKPGISSKVSRFRLDTKNISCRYNFFITNFFLVVKHIEVALKYLSNKVRLYVLHVANTLLTPPTCKTEVILFY